MIWNPPLSPTIMTVLVLLVLAATAGSYFLSRRQLALAPMGALVTAALRGLAFSLLLFLVLQPSRLPAPQTVDVKKTVAVLIDTSASMSRPAAGAGEAPTRLDQGRRFIRQHDVIRQIDRQAKLAVYAFDSRPVRIKVQALERLKAAGRQTDLGAAIEQTVRLHADDELVGVLLFSDGRNTQGDDPREPAGKRKMPLFTMGLGAEPKQGPQPQTQQAKRDLAVESVAASPRIILGRSAQVVASVSAVGYPSRQVRIELIEDDRVVSTSAVVAGPQRPRRQALFSVKPQATGIHSYQVRVPAEDGEADRTNNSKAFSIEVVDPVNRLLYVDRLRYERRFLRPVMEAKRRIRFTTVVQLDQDRMLVQGSDPQMNRQAASLSAEQLRGLKAVIFGDLPAKALTAQQIASLADWVDKGGALLLLAGPASLGPEGFAATPLARLLPVKLPPTARYREEEFRVGLTAEGAAHPAFQRVRGQWARATPLLSRFDVAAVKPAATVLMATTDSQRAPIVVSTRYGHGKTAIVLTDSTWRWQLGFAPAPGGGARTPPHALFWNQMIDWLLPDLKQARSEAAQVQLITDRTEYEVGDQVMLMINVRDADGSVPADANVQVSVSAPDGRSIQRAATLQSSADKAASVFTASFEAYAPGQYTIRAAADRDGRALGADQVGIRAAQPVIEFVQADPDHRLLQDLARISGGRYLEEHMLDDLASVIDMKARQVTVQPAETDAKPVWNRWWLAALFIGLMGAEWFVRRRSQWI